MKALDTLSRAEAEHFLDKGYVILKQCFDRTLAADWTAQAFARLGFDPDDAESWDKDIVWLDHHNIRPVAEIAPKAWGAICDIVGGEARIASEPKYLDTNHFTSVESYNWSDAFVVNFSLRANEVWQPPSATVKGWHKDGSFFRHFLDSYEQALLTIVLWSDVAPRGGGTFIAPDSIQHVARFLADHPEGVAPQDFDFPALISQCQEFIEITGEVGDVVIMHPFMLHASSANHAGKVRFISNPPIVLKEPLNFNRENPEDFSLLERATLKALGLERLDFQPTAPREDKFLARPVPRRVA